MLAIATVSTYLETGESWKFQLFGLPFSLLDVLLGLGISVCVVFVLTLGIFQQKTPVRSNSQRPSGRPLPGPWNFPLVGYIPKLGPRPFVTMWKLSRQYGSVYQLRIGSRNVVVINGMEALKQAFVRHGKTLSGRPDFSSFRELSRGKSLTFQSYSSVWKIHNKLTVRALSSFVKNTSRPVDGLVCQNARRLSEQLLARQGEVLDAYGFIEDSVLRVMYSLCFGDVVTDEFCDAIKNELDQMRAAMPVAMATDLMPLLAGFLRPHLQRFRETVRRYSDLVDEMTLSAGTSNFNQDSSCIVQSLILSAKELDTDPDSQEFLDQDKILTTIQDLIGAGSEGVVNFIYWAIRYMIIYPEVQGRLRAEVTSIITVDSCPFDKDRHLMPYVEGFIWEVIRHSSMSPLTLPHSALEDTVLYDFHIPKGTVVCGNLFSASHDPSIWHNPEKFLPERFFDESGHKFDRNKLEHLPCFGLGIRRCLGETLGRIEMFLFLIILVQNCRFEATKEDSLMMDGDMSLVYRSKPYKVIVSKI